MQPDEELQAIFGPPPPDPASLRPEDWVCALLAALPPAARQQLELALSARKILGVEAKGHPVISQLAAAKFLAFLLGERMLSPHLVIAAQDALRVAAEWSAIHVENQAPTSGVNFDVDIPADYSPDSKNEANIVKLLVEQLSQNSVEFVRGIERVLTEHKM
jgi:hypothetical protein